MQLRGRGFTLQLLTGAFQHPTYGDTATHKKCKSQGPNNNNRSWPLTGLPDPRWEQKRLGTNPQDIGGQIAPGMGTCAIFDMI